MSPASPPLDWESFSAWQRRKGARADPCFPGSERTFLKDAQALLDDSSIGRTRRFRDNHGPGLNDGLRSAQQFQQALHFATIAFATGRSFFCLVGRGIAHDSGRGLGERRLYCDGIQVAIRSLPGSAIREKAAKRRRRGVGFLRAKHRFTQTAASSRQTKKDE